MWSAVFAGGRGEPSSCLGKLCEPSLESRNFCLQVQRTDKKNMSSWKTCRSMCSWVVQCRTSSSWQYRKNYASQDRATTLSDMRWACQYRVHLVLQWRRLNYTNDICTMSDSSQTTTRSLLYQLYMLLIFRPFQELMDESKCMCDDLHSQDCDITSACMLVRTCGDTF